ncbi:hypothetical protein CCR75_002211 [Bremia lactucae]|uniref:Uncharacterized protein n=1 Tax=Bremia lactucae TaxID=4779 RepID=A0A976FNZ1_BRELC|nr:hypothetical protein CCR75_002211 [Bremia lactucae]
MASMPIYLRLYPIFLGCSAIGGFGLCQWFHATELEIREHNHDMSLKSIVMAVPQLLTATLLLYYACTFSRQSSAFVHPMVADSCLHQCVTSFMLASLIFSAFHLSQSLCCTSPVFCPIDQTVDQIVPCPVTVSNYSVYPRLLHSCATFIMLLALASIQPVHIIKSFQKQVHVAKFVTFSRREPVHDASAIVVY